ncbi:hypothetical protein D3C77_290540 [compost metagenome]
MEGLLENACLLHHQHQHSALLNAESTVPARRSSLVNPCLVLKRTEVNPLLHACSVSTQRPAQVPIHAPLAG